ncbi:MAG: DUF421 domain-containing protein [Alphaproteobacteria bacterium]|nr:DUF421 domain-containing protein [Alphaproteobacteria bacterium]
MLHALIGSGSQSITWWQMSLRGAVIFLYGLLLMRLFGTRAFSRDSPLDIVLAIIVGSNLSRAITANARFVPTLAATLAIVVLYWLLRHAGARWLRFGWLVKGAPVWLCRDGNLDRSAMRRTAVGEGDLDEAARRSGLPDASAASGIVLERSGQISTLG